MNDFGCCLNGILWCPFIFFLITLFFKLFLFSYVVDIDVYTMDDENPQLKNYRLNIGYSN